MIDLETAKQMAITKLLRHYEADLNTRAVIIDHMIEEHEWGWVIHWEPEDPSKVPEDEAKWGYFPVIVDRETGGVHPVGTAGPKAAIAKLLWNRQQLWGPSGASQSIWRVGPASRRSLRPLDRRDAGPTRPSKRLHGPLDHLG
jgi:hypothetical protein